MENIGVVKQNDATIRVILGEVFDVKAKTQLLMPVIYWHISMNENAVLELPVEPALNAFIYLQDGQLEINDAQNINTSQAVLFERDGGYIKLKANKASELLVLGGEVNNEPYVAQGPFVVNTQQDLTQAYADFQQRTFGDLVSTNGIRRNRNIKKQIMKVAVIGTTGFVGKQITIELVNRGIEVTGISRKEQQSDKPNLRYVAVDVKNIEALASALNGFDVIINAFSPGWTNANMYEDFIAGSKAIQQAVKQSGVKRFISIGGAGSLYLPDGTQMVDSFPADNPFVPGAKAARDYFNILKEETALDWAFFSPAVDMHQGITTGRTGKYRLGTDYPVMDDNGKNVLSVEDLAVVIADEVEDPKHHQMRFTAAY